MILCNFGFHKWSGWCKRTERMGFFTNRKEVVESRILRITKSRQCSECYKIQKKINFQLKVD